MKKTKQSSYNIEPVLLKQIKQYAIRNNTTLSAIINEEFSRLTHRCVYCGVALKTSDINALCKKCNK